jgi:hypothetical protein
MERWAAEQRCIQNHHEEGSGEGYGEDAEPSHSKIAGKDRSVHVSFECKDLQACEGCIVFSLVCFSKAAWKALHAIDIASSDAISGRLRNHYML